jgi:hypothetical protein
MIETIVIGGGSCSLAEISDLLYRAQDAGLNIIIIDEISEAPLWEPPKMMYSPYSSYYDYVRRYDFGIDWYPKPKNPFAIIERAESFQIPRRIIDPGQRNQIMAVRKGNR